MSETPWWQTGVIYQVYPRSFMDTDGDGVGDIEGIARRLDHLEWLGVDAVWLSPIFPSPMADFGYDVADYVGIDRLFGTLEGFDRLIADVHRRGMRLILDFVPNHSSDEHPWFVESRASRRSPRRDWYIWRDPAPDGGPPNNWRSDFGGSAWAWDDATGQYYYHAFLDRQPDLNWRNPDVKRAMFEVLRFWMNRGVDGFRVDVIWHLIKDDGFRDNPPNDAGDPHRGVVPLYTTDRPEVHDIIREMREVVDEFPGRLLIGEIYLPVERLVTYYGAGLRGVHLPFNFQLLQTQWDAGQLGRLIARYEGALPPGGWPNWVLGNHDKSRIATRVGPAQARVAAMLLLTLRGTPTIYYGDEIGMSDVAIPPEAIRDPFEKNVPGVGVGRDPERTPMQWDASPGAGFTTGTPWLPLAKDYASTNVAAERQDPRSMLSLHARLLRLRRAHPALSRGDWSLRTGAEDILAYERSRDGRRLLVALNIGSVGRSCASTDGRVLLSTHLDREGERVGGTLDLRPDEGVVVEILT